MYDCYMVVKKDKSEALVTFVQVMGRPNVHSRRILLKGLAPEKAYRVDGSERTYLGSTLMQAGILVENMWGDFQSRLIHVTEA